ncbi:MAG: FGGY-family carbohydrate kinase [Pseudomonadota bacterium]
MSLALGIDIGTSGVRTAVTDEAGRVLSMRRTAHLSPSPERMDASLWWQVVKKCVADQTAALTDHGHSGHDITRIAICGTSGTVVLTDHALRPVTRALMYNDAGFNDEAEIIARHAPKNHITSGGGSALARAMHLTQEDDNQRAAHLLHQADFIAAKLMGRGGLSDHNNALKTGFDPETETWPDWIDQVIDPRLLPDVHPASAPLGTIAPERAKVLGLSPRAIIHAGTTDSTAAFLACAPLQAGIAVTSLGSTLAIKTLSPRRIDDPRMGLYSHRIKDFWLAGGASNTGGAVLAAHFTSEQLVSLSAQIDPKTPSSLDYYPLLRPGERFPINDPNLSPRLTPRPQDDVDFLYGLLQGIARIEAQCYQTITDKGCPFPSQIFTAGSGAENPTWTAIRARALGITPQVSSENEAAVGAARLTQISGSD